MYQVYVPTIRYMHICSTLYYASTTGTVDLYIVLLASRYLVDLVCTAVLDLYVVCGVVREELAAHIVPNWFLCAAAAMLLAG